MRERLTFVGVRIPPNPSASGHQYSPGTSLPGIREIPLHGYTGIDTRTGFESVKLRISAGDIFLTAPFLTDSSWTGSEVAWELFLHSDATGPWLAWCSVGSRHIVDGAQVLFGYSSTLNQNFWTGTQILCYLTCERVKSELYYQFACWQTAEIIHT